MCHVSRIIKKQHLQILMLWQRKQNKVRLYEFNEKVNFSFPNGLDIKVRILIKRNQIFQKAISRQEFSLLEVFINTLFSHKTGFQLINKFYDVCVKFANVQIYKMSKM